MYKGQTFCLGEAETPLVWYILLVFCNRSSFLIRQLIISIVTYGVTILSRPLFFLLYCVSQAVYPVSNYLYFSIA